MKLFDDTKVGMRRKGRRLHDGELEVENVRLPRSEAEGAMQSAADFVELYGVVGEAFSQHSPAQTK